MTSWTNQLTCPVLTKTIREKRLNTNETRLPRLPIAFKKTAVGRAHSPSVCRPRTHWPPSSRGRAVHFVLRLTRGVALHYVTLLPRRALFILSGFVDGRNKTIWITRADGYRRHGNNNRKWAGGRSTRRPDVHNNIIVVVVDVVVVVGTSRRIVSFNCTNNRGRYRRYRLAYHFVTHKCVIRDETTRYATKTPCPAR